jgi:hypothetical protein
LAKFNFCPIGQFIQNNACDTDQSLTIEQYIYCAIATNLESLNASESIHFYNQHADDSENRIKAFKPLLS